jgi:hypothetical protein
MNSLSLTEAGCQRVEYPNPFKVGMVAMRGLAIHSCKHWWQRYAV